jgi:hypothetical protein
MQAQMMAPARRSRDGVRFNLLLPASFTLELLCKPILPLPWRPE